MLHSNCCAFVTGTLRHNYEGLSYAAEYVWVSDENLKWVDTSAIVFLSATQTYKDSYEDILSTILYHSVCYHYFILDIIFIAIWMGTVAKQETRMHPNPYL